MTIEPRRPEDRLLDAHLGQFSADDHARLESDLEADPLLSRKNELLGRFLRPLDHWQVSAPRPGLVDAVLDLLESRGARPAVHNPILNDRLGHRRSLLWTLREPLAIAACLLLLLGVGVPGVGRMRDASQRAMCATNLSSIFRGTASYQEAFAGSLPFAGWIAGSGWLPSDGNQRPYLSNSRHLFLLLKGSFVARPADFLCPGGPSGEPMRCDQLAVQNDFQGACNVSYATLNLAGPTPRLRPARAVAYAGDPNPLFVNARFNAGIDPDRTNSPAHRGRGQTVLTLDGSAAFKTSPIVGPKGDNLWLAGDIRNYTGTEAPTGDDDAQLVQGYPATDPVICNRGNK